MSLLSEIRSKYSPVRFFFHSRFPHVRNLLKDLNRPIRTVAPIDHIQHKNRSWYAWIGTAFDYRARYYFQTPPSSELIAYEGAERLGSGLPTDIQLQVLKSGGQLSPGAFWPLFDQWLSELKPEGRLLSRKEEFALNLVCLALAKFEVAIRVHPLILSPADWAILLRVDWATSMSQSLRILSKFWEGPLTDDMGALSRLFFERRSPLFCRPSVLNPTFAGSGDVGGADGDMIVGRMLIDIKCTTTALGVECLYQLLGYALLDYNDRFGIERLGLYLARQGTLVSWPVGEFLARISSPAKRLDLNSLRKAFKRAARH